MVRRYLPEAVPEEVLRRIVEVARRGPSAGYSQGQSFVVVTDPGLRREIARLAGEGSYVAKGFQPWVSGAPAHVILCTSVDIPERHRPFQLAAGCSMMLL